MNGVVADVGFIQDREERVFPLDYVARKITAEMKASANPRDIQACLHAGVLPDRYENTNLRIQLQSLGPVSYRLPEAHPQDAKLRQMPLQMRPCFDAYICPEQRHLYWKTATRDGNANTRRQQNLQSLSATDSVLWSEYGAKEGGETCLAGCSGRSHCLDQIGEGQTHLRMEKRDD